MTRNPYDLTPSEREWMALALSDALIPYGRDFDPAGAARLIEARLATMLARREALALRWAADDLYSDDSDDGPDHALSTATWLRERADRLDRGDA